MDFIFEISKISFDGENVVITYKADSKIEIFESVNNSL